MKQMSLFGGPTGASNINNFTVTYWKLYVDGAARNNPGPAGAGICLFKNDCLTYKQGFYLGSKTNNQAEYLALLLGIFFLRKNIGANDLALINSDSLLMVKQIEGLYKVKNPDLKIFHTLARTMLQGLRYDVAHVPREENELADEMANAGIDKKIALPQDFLALLSCHEIVL
jgi:ribonuclease HI